MPKKILVAEKSDTIRGIAESILHQNGYDVVSAATLEKAKELIITAQPNLIVLGADLKDESGKYLYDSIEENPGMVSIPLLLIADPDGRSLPYPDEVILSRPFEPRDFLDRIRLFVGGGTSKPDSEKAQLSDPFAMGTVDDEFLDAALGIEKISVESSEELDKSWMTGKLKTGRKTDKGDAFDIAQSQYEDQEKKGPIPTVETLMIREDNGTVKDSKKAPTKLSGTSKIEISSDQYGLVNQENPAQPDVVKQSPHDYDWFINEMQKESANITFSPESPKAQSKANSEVLESAPGAVVETEHPQIRTSEEIPQIQTGSVDKFIEKFKEEVKKLAQESPAAPDFSPEPPIEIPDADPDEIRHFSNYVAELLAERLAKEITSKLDSEMIFKLVKDDLAKILAAKK